MGGYRSRYGRQMDWLDLTKDANALLISPNDDLLAEYNWLKSSDRDGVMGDATATNRRTLILAPGVYVIGATTITLDEDFVDITTLDPTNSGCAYLYSDSDITVMEQTAKDVRLSGFTVRSSGTSRSTNYGFDINNANSGTTATTTASSDNVAATGIGAGIVAGDEVYLSGGSVVEGWYEIESVTDDDNIVTVEDVLDSSGDVNYEATSVRSTYRYMYFAYEAVMPIYGISTINGVFEYCESDDFGWHNADGKQVRATFRFCKAGGSSFGAAEATGPGISGKFYSCIAGNYGFGGCVGEGLPITSDAYFEDCEAGLRSFAMGEPCAGTFKRCIGGEYSFGGTLGEYHGVFSGYAEDCITTKDGFGGGPSTSKNTGELVRCRCTAMSVPLLCEGAIVRHSYLQVTGTDQDCITLLDSNCKIYNSTLIANGTGQSIDAGSALNVIAVHCRMNTDKGSNVTNLVASQLTDPGSLEAGGCIVDSNVS